LPAFGILWIVTRTQERIRIYMYKFLLFLAPLIFSFSLGCRQPTALKERVPYHKEIVYPVTAVLLNIECGEPCVLFRDDKTGNFVALMVDGSTITVRPESEVNN